MNLTREQVQAYLELEKKATPGPWYWQAAPKGRIDLVCRNDDETIRGTVILPCEYAYEDDGLFITESRTIAPQLAEAYLQMPDVREPVRWFSEQMEAKLKENDHKGGWGKCDPWWLLDRLKEEVRELEESAIDLDITAHEIIQEAADVANFAMMIADIARQFLQERSESK